MTGDEIGGRADREPLLPRGARVALAAVVVVLAGLLGLAQLRGAPEPGPAPSHRPTPAGLAGSERALAASDWVDVASVCPVETDRRTRLTVRFVLVNASSRPVTIESVHPVLPLGGLRTSGAWVGGGDCHRLAPQVRGGPVPPGGQRLAMLSFRLPRECPAAVLVAARARLVRGGVDEVVDLAPLALLAADDFDACGR